MIPYYLRCGCDAVNDPFHLPDSVGFCFSNLHNLLGFFAILQWENDLMDAFKKPASQDLGDSMLTHSWGCSQVVSNIHHPYRTGEIPISLG